MKETRLRLGGEPYLTTTIEREDVFGRGFKTPRQARLLSQSLLLREEGKRRREGTGWRRTAES